MDSVAFCPSPDGWAGALLPSLPGWALMVGVSLKWGEQLLLHFCRDPTLLLAIEIACLSTALRGLLHLRVQKWKLRL